MYSVQQTTPFLTRAFAATLAAGAILASGASHAAEATGNSNGTVVQPIAITSVADLSFGSFAPGASPGSITISTSGDRTANGVVVISSSSGAAARFDITGSAGATYSITHGGTTVLTNTGGAGETMALAKFSDLTAGNATSGEASTGTLDGTGAQSLYVGGTLSVAANQPVGVYEGTVIATVEYN